jgi:ABC-type multidrug transport system fused ATPase/permease subunit
MTPTPSRLWNYVRPYGWLLAVSLCLVVLVGVLEAVTPFLIGLIFDTLLRASNAPTISIPWINVQFNTSVSDGRVFLLLPIAAAAVKAVAEYGSVNSTAYLGQAVVRDLRNDVFEKILFQPLRFFHFQSNRRTDLACVGRCRAYPDGGITDGRRVSEADSHFVFPPDRHLRD